MVVTSRVTQRTAGAAESAAAASAAAAAVGPSAKAGVFNKVSAISTTGLQRVLISLNISSAHVVA